MTSIRIFLFLLFFNFGFSQDTNYEIIFKDKETNLPVKNVQVLIFRTNQDLISNDDGVVKFNLKKPSRIQFSHDGYKKQSVNSTALTSNINEVYLLSLQKDIEDVIVSNKHPQVILKSLIENSTKKLTLPVHLKVYSREFFKVNDKYITYNDGLINFCLSGDAKSIKTDLLVEQNRKVGLPDDENISVSTFGYNLNDIMQNYYDFKYLKPFANSKARKKYDYELKTYPANPDYNVMIIKLMDNVLECVPDFKILYDFKKKIIIEFSYQLPPERLEYAKVIDFSVSNGKLFLSNFVVNYKLDNDLYFMFMSNESIGFYAKNKKNKETKIEIKNFMIATNQDKNWVSYEDKDVFKDKSLINRPNKIITNFWDFDSGFALTEKENEIIKSLSNN